MDNKKPQITLAICTCNRTGLLKKLLKSIQVSKPCDIANIEVLVVDNHKSHNAINVVQNMSDFKYSLHYISEERAGVPYARNTACDWCVSRSGEAIIFVDDDESCTIAKSRSRPSKPHQFRACFEYLIKNLTFLLVHMMMIQGRRPDCV